MSEKKREEEKSEKKDLTKHGIATGLTAIGAGGVLLGLNKLGKSQGQEKSSKVLKTAGLGTVGIGGALAGYSAYKHYKNKKKEEKDASDSKK